MPVGTWMTGGVIRHAKMSVVTETKCRVRSKLNADIKTLLQRLLCIMITNLLLTMIIIMIVVIIFSHFHEGLMGELML